MMVPQWERAAKQYALRPTMDLVKFNRSACMTPPPGRNPRIGRSTTSFAQRPIGRPTRITLSAIIFCARAITCIPDISE